jgi:hypothetical protein
MDGNTLLVHVHVSNILTLTGSSLWSFFFDIGDIILLLAKHARALQREKKNYQKICKQTLG